MSRALPSARARACVCFLVLLALSASGVSAQRSGDVALQRLTAQLLPRVEALAGLRATRPINVARRSRAELRSFLASRLEEEVASGHLAAVERVYKLLGLIPDTLDLTSTSAALLGEQIVGYYDPRRDTLYVLTDVPARELRHVLVHEMVHALQDQYVPLDSLFARERGSDRQAAARAAVEGHATLVMWLFATEERTGRRPALAELPDLSLVPFELFFPDRPLQALAAAPLILRESLIFPYTRGAGFIQALWRRDPTAVPFGSQLPLSSEQVLDPERRFFAERDSPTEVHFSEPIPGEERDGHALSGAADAREGSRWRVVYENTLGQFELSVLLKQRHFQVGSEKYARGWAGDRYLLLSDGRRHALLWYLIWDDARSAFDFATAYRQILHARLNESALVEELTLEGRPAVRIVETHEGVELSTIPRPRVRLAAERG